MRGMVIRWVLRIVGVVLVVVLATVLVVRMYGAHRLAIAERSFNARFGDVGGFASPKVPEEENAAIYLRAGAEAMVLFGNDKPRAGDLTMSAPSAWSEEERAFRRDLLARNAPAIELLHRASGLKRSSFGLVDSGDLVGELNNKLPALKILWAQRLLLLDATLALHDGDRTHFLTDARTMATLATAMDRESPLISLLIGVAAEKMLLSAVNQAVEDPSTDLTTLTTLRGMLVDTDLRAAWRRTNGAEGRAIHEWVARTTTRCPEAGNALGGWIRRTDDASGRWAGRIKGFVFRDVLQAQVLDLRQDAVAIVDQPFGLNPPWVTQGLATPRTMFGALEAVTFQNIANSGGRVQTAWSQRNLARVALALRAQALDTGSYPASLAGLVDSGRVDPFVGKPLAYERRADGSAVISVPDGSALWKRLSNGIAASCPYTWELPAPAATMGRPTP